MASVGLAGRVPAANDVKGLWDILTNQREGLSGSESSSMEPMSVEERFVPRYGLLDDVGAFDATYWGLSESEARNLDPQVIV